MKRLICCLLLYAATIPDALGLSQVTVAQFGKEKFLLYLPLYIAMEEGYFESEGLSIHLVFAGNDDQAFAAVASRSADFGIGDPVFAAIAEEKGLHARVVALLIQKLAVSGFTNRSEIGEITTPSQLKDLKIGSFPRPSTTYTMLDEILKTNRSSTGSARIVEGAMGTFAPMLRAQVVDMALDLEPAVSIAESQGMRVVFDLSRFFPSQAVTGLTARADYLSQNKETALRMVRGLERALRLINSDSPRPSEIAATLFPALPRPTIERAVERMRKQQVYPVHATVDPALWSRTVEARVKSGDLKSAAQASSAVDNSFAEQAVQEQKP